ncbi:peptidoglycan DD-metalloendopeptidase family protein [Curvibacter sp. HBC61]|uniref:Peptidoglycan DD-metalloendopeptidase family protein n=1 Tax=Curvibacter cyanobacteriorum TaxID=3026422 RepID=A0ABT5MT24_9BURK|nr:peptidoglycan DD-metalloendopeptidase family protein [Curvibacter sp. HBC61]MDD0837198.1 peptidoglycan DD-metalloendopeptidase family protein [Curvibacter sp. HBC61]
MWGWQGRGALGSAVVLALLLAGCASKTTNRAPVEERGAQTSTGEAVTSSAAAPVAPAKPLPGAENAGKPGYYTVKPGDTLIRIGLETGQNWRDLVRWNNLDNPNLIEVGQVLRVVPPGATVTESGAVTRPVGAAVVTPVPAGSTRANGTATATVTPAPAPAPAAAAPSDDDPGFMWPTSGALLAGFDEAKNKGLDLAGKAGDPVLAAADGRVVYAGAGLRGYGNLIILKHNNTFLTAYAHNQLLLVKEDQAVRKGQKIAEMGNSDADRVKLHFEIRRQGKPVDPTRYLPAR